MGLVSLVGQTISPANLCEPHKGSTRNCSDLGTPRFLPAPTLHPRIGNRGRSRGTVSRHSADREQRSSLSHLPPCPLLPPSYSAAMCWSTTCPCNIHHSDPWDVLVQFQFLLERQLLSWGHKCYLPPPTFTNHLVQVVDNDEPCDQGFPRPSG